MNPSLPNLSWKQRLVLGATCALVIATYAYMTLPGETEFLTRDASKNNYNLLVEGFRAGQLSLKKDVPTGLAQLSDPYDPAQNTVFRGAPYSVHDLSYYKGRLYLYFGVTPALILFWPYFALTGKSCFQTHAVAFFCSLGFLAAVGLLFSCWRRCFTKVKTWVVAAVIPALGFAPGIPLLFHRCDVNEVAISCAYMLTMLALGAIWLAFNHPQHRGRWLAVASLLYGLAIGARPSLIFGAVILVLPVIQSWKERGKAGLVLAAVGPITVIVSGLMLYNALRFDSLFEFGRRYQLSPEREGSQVSFSLQYLWFNFRVYFLEPVRWTKRFPFADNIRVPPLPPGHGFVEEPFGVLTNVPFVWLALGVPLAWRSLKGNVKSTLRWFALAVLLFSATSALVVCLYFVTCFRYQVDFLPGLILLATIGVLGLETQFAGSTSPRIALRFAWCLLLSFSVAFNLLASIQFSAIAHNVFGSLCVRSRKLEEATKHYERALRLKPDYAMAHNNLANLLAVEGHFEEAIQHYELAVKSDPELDSAHHNLALVLRRTGDFNGAINHLRTVIRRQPGRLDTRVELGETLVDAERYAEASEVFRQGLELAPQHIILGNDLAWLLATCPDSRQRNAKRAVQLGESLAESTEHKVPGVLDTLAAAYAEAGRFKEAVVTAREGLAVARANNDTNLVAQLTHRLALYEQRQPYRLGNP